MYQFHPLLSIPLLRSTFLLHVPPNGFQRIRYYGFLANRYREQKLAHCREHLGMPICEPPALEAPKNYLIARSDVISGPAKSALGGRSAMPQLTNGRILRRAEVFPLLTME
jgi:Putative transposase